MRFPITRTTREMKKNNVVMVSDVLKALGSATKAEVALQTGLSVATCGTVLNALHHSGEAIVIEAEPSRGGRPALRYACNPDYFSLLSLYAEGDDHAATLVWSVSSATGDLLAQGEEAFQTQTLEWFYQQVDEILQAHPNVQALGVGLPGVVAEGVVLSCDISLFNDVPIMRHLQERFGLYVQTDNDMNYIAWGFYRSSCAGVTAPVAYIHKPAVPCTGCGIVVNGQVLQGASYFAGEVSNLPGLAGQSLVDEMATIVVSLVAIINPVTVALTGPNLNDTLLPEIARRCAGTLPLRHIPRLIYRPSARQDYLQGIAELTSQEFIRHRLFSD